MLTPNILTLLVPNTKDCFVNALMEQYRLDISCGQSSATEESYEWAVLSAIVLTAEYSTCRYQTANDCVPDFRVFAKYLTGTILWDAVTSFCQWMDSTNMRTLCASLADDPRIQLLVLTQLPDVWVSPKNLLYKFVNNRYSVCLAPFTDRLTHSVKRRYVSEQTLVYFDEALANLNGDPGESFWRLKS